MTEMNGPVEYAFQNYELKTNDQDQQNGKIIHLRSLDRHLNKL